MLMVEPQHLDQLLHPQFADEDAYKGDVVGSGGGRGHEQPTRCGLSTC